MTDIQSVNGHIVITNGDDEDFIALDLGAVLRIEQYTRIDLTPRQAGKLGALLTTWAEKPHHNRRALTQELYDDAMVEALGLHRTLAQDITKDTPPDEVIPTR